MGIKRSVIGLVTMAVAVGAVAIGQSTAKPSMYYDMPNTAKVARSIVTADSATTSTAPKMYYD